MKTLTGFITAGVICTQIWIPVYSSELDDLDEITIKVIGLDELPSTSVDVINLPEPDLGEMQDLNESYRSSRSDAPIPRVEEGDNLLDAPPQADAPVGD